MDNPEIKMKMNQKIKRLKANMIHNLMKMIFPIRLKAQKIQKKLEVKAMMK